MDKQQTMPCKATASAPARSTARKRCAGYLALITLATALLAGCDASAQNITAAMKADAEARQTIASAQLAQANAVFTEAQADADSQAAYALMLDESYSRYTDVQEARVREAQTPWLVAMVFAFVVAVVAIGLHYATRTTPAPAPQIIERQVIVLQPRADGRVLWRGSWIPREQLEAHCAQSGRQVQVWQEGR